jgi:hypothetical protein
VKSVIVFRDGRRINLTDGVTAELYAELEATQGHSSRSDPILFCGGCGGSLYIQHGRKNRNDLFGWHHVADGCPETFAITGPGMSDEHKRQAEYHVRAARAQGLEAETEVTTTGRTRVDVVIRDGTTGVGIEVQRSHVTAAEATGRTSRSVASGTVKLVAWATDVSDHREPAWMRRVPYYRIPSQEEHWRAVPDLRSVRAYGVADIDRERSWRGGWEPKVRLLRPLVDVVVADLVTGSLRPVMHDKNVILMTAAGIARWEEITGYPLPEWSPARPAKRSLIPSVEVKCRRPRAASSGHSCEVPECSDRPNPYGIGWYCTAHRWQIELAGARLARR